MGVKCRDGIVVAADSIAVIPSTLGTDYSFTMEKTLQVGENTLFSGAGAISTLQRAHEVIKSYGDELDEGITCALRDRVINNLVPAYSRRIDVFKTVHRDEDSGWSADILIAGVQKGGGDFVLWHIAKDLNDEIVNDMGYYATGIGGLSAYTLMKVWYDNNMTIDQTIPLVGKVIRTVSGINPLVNSEPNIWYLDRDGVHKVTDYAELVNGMPMENKPDEKCENCGNRARDVIVRKMRERASHETGNAGILLEMASEIEKLDFTPRHKTDMKKDAETK